MTSADDGGIRSNGRGRFWITPPELLARLDAEFGFDFDPCPYPRPPEYNSLVLPWGRCNYVNPPFVKNDGPFGGPSAFVRKAIEEAARGNTSVVMLPVTWSIALALRAGAEWRYVGRVPWLEADRRTTSSRSSTYTAALILRGKNIEVTGPAETRKGFREVLPTLAGESASRSSSSPSRSPNGKVGGCNVP